MTRRVVAISAAGQASLALQDDGSVVVWGWNFGGRLAVGPDHLVVPVVVIGPGSGVSSVSAGDLGMAALRSDGSLLTWGYGVCLGTGSRAMRLVPAPVPRLHSVVSVSYGASCLALLKNGSILGWGHTGPADGDDRQRDRLRPVPILGLSEGIAAVSAGHGSGHLALRQDGAVLEWPSRPDLQSPPTWTPAVVPRLDSGVAAIDAGQYHKLALLEDGAVMAWGFNPQGAAGDVRDPERRAPAIVRGLPEPATAVAAGGSHSLALLASGAVVAWGGDSSGQLGGRGSMHRDDLGLERRMSRTAVPIEGLGGRIVAIAAGAEHCLALRDDGMVLSWGNNLFGELGDGVPIEPLKPVSHSFAAAVHRVSPGELRQRLAERGLERHAPFLLAQAAPSVRLRARPASRADRAVGATRLGGLPDLPVGLRWPRLDGEPLAFIAQIDLATAARHAPDGLLPSSGLLSVFVATWDIPPGYDPEDRGAGQVLYSAPGTRLRRRHIPVSVPDRFPCVGLVPEPDITYPSPFWHELLAAGMDDAAMAAYEDALGDSDMFIHRLLGHPDEVQPHNMPFVCQLVASGARMTGEEWRSDPRSAALGQGARDWTLLLQLDGEDAADMCWGDAGRLYFWIRRQDLESRRFDRTWMLFEAH